MKLLTLNTHSLAEKHADEKREIFAEMIAQELPDVFALQEVNQRIEEDPVLMDGNPQYIPCRGFSGPVRRRNHALSLAELLKEKNCPYFWTWVPAKIGYGIYEEGLSLFSRSPIEQAEQLFISRNQDFSNWRTRKSLGIKTRGEWFYSVHMGWWKDEEEPFARHWDCLSQHLQTAKSEQETIWICGDFNSPSDVLGEGYSYVKDSGWQDTYELAKEKDSGITVSGVIDGWRNQNRKEIDEGMRIDYIWCSKKRAVRQSRVVFNGKHYPIVSDHYCVMIETEEIS